MRKGLELEGKTYGIYNVNKRVEKPVNATEKGSYWEVRCILCRSVTVRHAQQVVKGNTRCMCRTPAKEEDKSKLRNKRRTDHVMYGIEGKFKDT